MASPTRSCGGCNAPILDPNARFCGQCGREHPRSPPAAPRARRRWPLYGCAAILALVLGAAAVAFVAFPDDVARLVERLTGDEQEPAAASPGVMWHGSLRGRWDFRMDQPVTEDGVLRFRFSSWERRNPSAQQSGTMEVSVSHRKVKLVLRSESGEILRLHDGIFSNDGRFCGGLAYTEGPSRGGTLWWATVEQTPPVRGERAPLNSIGVGGLELLLPNGRDAWPVVERRLVRGRYTSASELGTLGLDPASLALLLRIGDV
jgi:hypothetical protein